MKAKPGQEDRMRTIAKDLIVPSRAEDGYVAYMTHESTEDAGVFMFYLIRTNEDSFQKHVASPHVQAFDATGAAAEVLVGPYLHSRQRHMG